MSGNRAVRASGGLVLRGSGASTELMVIHRPQYDDWTLPKGKDEEGETSQQAAVREVHEETGLLSWIAGTAGVTEYPVKAGPKAVTYYLMRPYRFTGFVATEEVDETRWVSPTQARDLLTYDFDRGLVAELDLAAATVSSTLHLVRHGSAGERSDWPHPDEMRPLTEEGRRQARALGEQMIDVGVERILSSPFVRCVETCQPLADRIGVNVEPHPALSEGPDRRALAELLDSVTGTTTVLATHGDVIPALLEQLQRSGVRLLSSYQCAKGSTWMIGHNGHRFTDAIYLPSSTASTLSL